MLLLADSLGNNNWSNANTIANEFMPSYNSRLITYQEANRIPQNDRKFSNNWWISKYYSSYYYVDYNYGNISYSNSSSNTYATRPVITIPDSAKVTGGSGTSDNPYVLSIN